MINFVKNYLQNRRRKKLLVNCELERRKENFVYRFLLNHYELLLRDKVDFGAWYYATLDMETIKASSQLDKAYNNAMRIVRNQFEKEKQSCN